MIDIPQKLQIKAGMTVLVMRPPRDFVLGPLPDNTQITDSGKGPFDLVLAFVGSRLDVEHVAPNATKRLSDGGILWMCYPKTSSGVETDVTRDRGWETLSAAGWFAVTQIALDEVWSALRFKRDPALGAARAKRAAARKPAAKKPRGEEARGEEARGEEARGEEARGEEARGEEARGEEARGEEARGEEARGEEARGEEVGLPPSRAKRLGEGWGRGGAKSEHSLFATARFGCNMGPP